MQSHYHHLLGVPSLSSKVKVNVQSSSAQPLVISHTVTVHSDFTWTLTVHGHVVSQEQCSAILGSASSNSLLLGRETNTSKTNPDFSITLGARGSGELPPTAPDPPRLSVLLERPASYRKLGVFSTIHATLLAKTREISCVAVT